jgi:hypothetical protein
MVRRLAIFIVLLALCAVPVFANHAWSTYHWSTTSYPMPIKVGDNVTAVWDPYLNEAIADWNKSTKLALVKVAGGSSKQCRPTAGRIEVCNSNYGQNGWLGLAQIWLSGGHISQGTAKMNDTYYASATYNTPGWRDLVMCQEVGHDFGLGHQNEINTNLNTGSCMDYTNYPDGGGTGGNLSNRAPNAHDYDVLNTIYAHTHASNSYSATYEVMVDAISRGGNQMPVVDMDDLSEPWQWGTPIAWNGEGQAIRFAREIGTQGGDHGSIGRDGNMTVITEVFWAPIPVSFDSPAGNLPNRDRSK